MSDGQPDPMAWAGCSSKVRCPGGGWLPDCKVYVHPP